MEDSFVKATITQLKKAVNERNTDSFEKAYFKLTGLCRKYILNADKKLLSATYPELSSLLTWFYQNNAPRWPEINRKMGSIDAFLSLMGNLRHTRTAREAFVEIRKSRKDQSILLELYKEPSGILSGELAARLESSPNALTNRLPGLEKKGLITRYRRGKNSLVFLTPKGISVASGLSKNSHSQDFMPDDQSAHTFIDVFRQEKPIEDKTYFWIN